MAQFSDIVGYLIGKISILLSLIIVLIFNKLSKPLKLIGVYILVGTIIEILSIYIEQKFGSNLFLIHIFCLFEFIILTITFNLIYKSYGEQLNLNYFLVIGASLVILNTLIFQKITQFNSYSSTFTSIAIIIYCIYFFKLILDDNTKTLQKDILKWSIISIFIYHTTSMFVLLFSNILIESKNDAQFYIWSIRMFIMLLCKLILLFYFGKYFFTLNLKYIKSNG